MDDLIKLAVEDLFKVATADEFFDECDRLLESIILEDNDIGPERKREKAQRYIALKRFFRLVSGSNN